LKGSYQIITLFQELIKKHHIEDRVELKASFCLGHCTRGVSVKVGDGFLEGLTLTNAEEKFNEYILNKVTA
jgi:NADH:ubiquinone oxidoreductase subunit E